MIYARRLLALATCSLLSWAIPQAHAQSLITEWTFDNFAAGTTNLTPAPSIGSGLASSVGMGSTSQAPFSTAGATGPDTSNIDNISGTDTDNSGTGNNVWQIVGTNGWNTAAAIGTQGAQFSVSTLGYTNLSLSFDIEMTSKGEANFQVQYSLNGTSNWQNVGTLTTAAAPSPAVIKVLSNTTAINPNIVNGTYINVATSSSSDTWFNGIDANLSSIAAANNDPNLAFRIVNAATGTSDIVLHNGAVENNTSGNWRLDDVEVSGLTAIPEPADWALYAGIAAFVAVLMYRWTPLRRAANFR
ncbi:MAG TPA: hypothetical protein VII09_01050 [Opitutaceae bacterium]